MKKLLLVLILSSVQLGSYACVISPYENTIRNAEYHLSNSDIVFFGRFNSGAIDEELREQIASFTVIKSYKGNVSGGLVIINSLGNSCSRLFELPMSAYYVFAKYSDTENVYRIDGRATFVPLEYSLEQDWAPEQWQEVEDAHQLNK